MHLLQDTGSDTRGKKSARWRGGRMLCTLSKNQGECQCLEHRWKMVKTPAQVWKLIVNSLFGRCKQSPFGLAGWYLRRAWQPVFNGHVATKEARKPFGHSTGALFAVWTRRYEKQSRFDPIRSPCGLVLFDAVHESWLFISLRRNWEILQTASCENLVRGNMATMSCSKTKFKLGSWTGVQNWCSETLKFTLSSSQFEIHDKTHRTQMSSKAGWGNGFGSHILNLSPNCLSCQLVVGKPRSIMNWKSVFWWNSNFIDCLQRGWESMRRLWKLCCNCQLLFHFLLFLLILASVHELNQKTHRQNSLLEYEFSREGVYLDWLLYSVWVTLQRARMPCF